VIFFVLKGRIHLKNFAKPKTVSIFALPFFERINQRKKFGIKIFLNRLKIFGG
jgi:hypothetical protein